MRKSRGITLTLMAGLAAACSDGRRVQETASSGDFGGPAEETRRCVDEQNRVVSDDQCTRPHGAGYYPFFFYYGGRALASGGGAYMSGGTRTTLGAPAPARSGVSRGGFGARAAGRSGAIGS